MSNGSVIDDVLDLFHGSKRAVVLSHTSPDADAYGSSCGLAAALKQLGISVVVYNESGFVPRYAVIPGAKDVSATIPPPLAEDDVLVVCDCGALERVGELLVPYVRAATKVINIDHHNANTNFGQINYVVDGASSTSELVFNLLKEAEHRLSRNDIITSDVAACLLAGIIGDTGSFRYPSTSAKTFLAAHDLMERGARPDKLTQELFANHSLPAIKLQAEAMININILNNGAFAEVTVTQEMLKRLGAELLDADSLAERARDIEGVKVSVLFKQDVDMWRVSLRSRLGAVDVAAIAQSFGGGGHKPAAAFRWRNGLDLLKSELRDKVSNALSTGHA